MSITFERPRVRPRPDDQRLTKNRVGAHAAGTLFEAKVSVERPPALTFDDAWPTPRNVPGMSGPAHDDG